MPSATRIALLHDDCETTARIAEFAGQAKLELIQASSAAALEAELSNPLIGAVVLDVTGPSGAGFDLLERAAKSPSSPQVIVVTALGAKAVESIRRLGMSKGLNLRVFRKGENTALNACVAALEKRELQFTAEHLREAIEREYLRVEYQPKVPLAGNGEEYGVEALCRLRHPKFGNVVPEQFIGLAEKHGLIARLTDYVVCEAFRDFCDWGRQDSAVKLAINLSPELLTTPHWCEQFIERCREYDIEPGEITLEITESKSGATLDIALGILRRLRQKGFMLSIDDFGAGFSSLARLYKLPFTELKIDKSFTFDFPVSAEARAFIESTIRMARCLGLKVVAEGVETEAVFRELRVMGCQQAQGYFISKSLPAEKVPAFFADWTASMKTKPFREEKALQKIALQLRQLLDQKSIRPKPAAANIRNSRSPARKTG